MHDEIADTPGELQDDALTADFRLLQRRRGHRYSLDDVVVAWEAARARPAAARCLDLGCGVGSVLLMLAWKLPQAELAAIEAQPTSFELARRNVARNGVADRVQLEHGDLRERMLLARFPGGPFELVTGTPPYLPPEQGVPPPDAQKRHARMELRGGVEDYVHAAGRVLAPGGRAVICAGADRSEGVIGAARSAGLAAERRRDVVPRAGRKGPLFTVWTLARPEDAASAPAHAEAFVARDEDGARTEAYRAVRRFFGLPDQGREPPSP